jgi:hypothetical protein
MQNRSAKFASALVVCLVATTALAIASDGNAASEAECLAGPKGTPPEGSHWFYGTDHGNNRKCWFLGDAQQKRAITKRVAVAEKPVHRKPKPAMPRQIADARAELPPRVANEPWSVSPARVATATPPSTDNSANADALGEAPRWTLAGRWPDRTDADATIGSEPMAAEKAEAPSKCNQQSSTRSGASFDYRPGLARRQTIQRRELGPDVDDRACRLAGACWHHRSRGVETG